MNTVTNRTCSIFYRASLVATFLYMKGESLSSYFLGSTRLAAPGSLELNQDPLIQREINSQIFPWGSSYSNWTHFPFGNTWTFGRRVQVTSPGDFTVMTGAGVPPVGANLSSVFSLHPANHCSAATFHYVSVSKPNPVWFGKNPQIIGKLFQTKSSLVWKIIVSNLEGN